MTDGGPALAADRGGDPGRRAGDDDRDLTPDFWLAGRLEVAIDARPDVSSTTISKRCRVSLDPACRRYFPDFWLLQASKTSPGSPSPPDDRLGETRGER